MISLQQWQRHPVLLQTVALLVAVCVTGCSTPSTPRQKALRSGLISGGAATAIALALGGDPGQALAVGLALGLTVGTVVYVRNEIAVSRESVNRAESELARLLSENPNLSKKLKDAQGQRLAAFQLGDSKKIVLLDTRTGKSLARPVKTSSGTSTSAPLGFELSSIPAAPGEESEVAYRTNQDEAEKSFPVLFMGKI